MKGFLIKQVLQNVEKRLTNNKYIVNYCKSATGINDNEDYEHIIVIIKADYLQYEDCIYRIEIELDILDGQIINYINHNNISVSGNKRNHIKNIRSSVIDLIYELLQDELNDNLIENNKDN